MGTSLERGTNMKTLIFVQHCQYQTSAIQAIATTDQFVDDEGYTDYETYDHVWNQQRNNVLGMIEECTNPTLPSYIRMVETAIKHKIISEEDVAITLH
jgi:hypothetical protein